MRVDDPAVIPPFGVHVNTEPPSSASYLNLCFGPASVACGPKLNCSVGDQRAKPRLRDENNAEVSHKVVRGHL